MELRAVGFDESRLLAPGRALEIFFQRTTLPQPRRERIELDGALGRYLAVDLRAESALPVAARSAMDGFALAAASAPGRVRIVGAVAMGRRYSGRVGPGEAVRIPTGGVLPPGCDAVLPIEAAHLAGDELECGPIASGEAVTPAGSDVGAGELLLMPGRRIGAPELSLLATLGYARVEVFRRPRIAVLSSGDELVAIDRRPEAWQVRDSNRYAIAGALRAIGAEAVHLPSIGDAPGELLAALEAAIATFDAVVLSGGSSVGERDETPVAVAALGSPGTIVHGLKVKPGKPTLLGAIGGVPILGLPGNPSSSLLILDAVGGPILARLCGAQPRTAAFSARLGAPVQKRRGWTWYVPVAVQQGPDGLVAQPLALRSSMTSLAARSDGYLALGEGIETLAVGERVDIYRYAHGGPPTA